MSGSRSLSPGCRAQVSRMVFIRFWLILSNITLSLTSMLGPPPPPSYPPVVSDDSVSVDPLRPEINIDVARLEGIFSYNAFNPLPIAPFHSGIRRPLEIPTDLSAAVYALPSMFNHACLANPGWQSLGDVVIIRARRPIAAGEEITIPYTTGYYEDRCRFLPSMIGCPCEAHERRAQHLEAIPKHDD